MLSYRSARVVDLPGSFEGRSVLVTGHTGFKGAWLAALLTHYGARVTGFSLPPPTKPSLFELLAWENEMESIPGDVRSAESVSRCVAKTRPEYIFHLAAQSLVRAGYDHPVDTYAINVLGTVHLLEAARKLTNPCVVIVVTSDKCYRNREWIWGYREDEALGGEDPYSSSKAAAEMVAHAYAASYSTLDLHIATARAGNVIGGGDWSPDRLVPDVVRAVTGGHPLTLRFPNATRPWQHVLDSLTGYLTLAAAGAESRGAWNFGPEGSAHYTVHELATEVFKALGKPANIKIDDALNRHEAGMLRLDSTKARESLGWRGKLDAHQTVAWTAAWYRDVLSGRSAREATLEQIGEYIRR